MVPSPETYMTDVTKMTIGGWFYADKANAYMRLFSAKASNGQDGGWEVWANNGSCAKFGVTGGTKSKNVYPSNATYDCLGRWVHFMAVYNGTNVKLYVNGEKYIDGTVGAITARAASGDDPGGYGFMIGGMPRLNDASWYGCYDEVRLYDGAMSEERVRALYLAESLPAAFLRAKPRSAGGIVQERPYYGTDFTHSMHHDGQYAISSGMPTSSTGTGFLYGFGEQLFSFQAIVGIEAISSMGGKAMTTVNGSSNHNIAGQGFKYGSGDWTCHVRARTGDVTNGVVWCLGGGAYEMALTANGLDGVSLVTLQNNVLTPLSRLDVEVPHANVSYHDYAVVFHVSGTTVDLYVDGVFKGTIPYANFTASDDRWKFFYLWAANANFVHAKDCRIEDVRFYKRALTAAELASLHGFLSFSAPERNVYAATVTENCQFTDLVWTPEMPSEGFGPDDILDVTCASSDCTVSMPADNLPSVAGLVMRGGTLKHAVAHITSAPKWIKLENGASLDENGCAQYVVAAYPRIVLGDSAYLRNNGAALNYGNAQFTNGIELMPGVTAFLHTTGTMGLIGDNYIKVFDDLNGGTLVKTGAGMCYMANIEFNGGGTLEVREGTVQTYKTALMFGETKVDVKSGATFNSGVAGTVGTVKGAGAVNSTAGTLTIGKELSGLLTVGGAAATSFANGATLDLSANASPFVQPSTMTFAGAVNIVLPDGVRGKTKLISWDAPPADGVTFAVVGGLPYGMKLDVRSDGLYLVYPGMIIIVK